MQDDKFNRSLDGTERERERIAIRRNQNALDRIGLEVKLNLNQIERLQIDNEEKEKQVKEITESIEIGKKLVNGAKIKDVVPHEKLYGKPKEETKTEEKKQEGN